MVGDGVSLVGSGDSGCEYETIVTCTVSASSAIDRRLATASTVMFVVETLCELAAETKLERKVESFKEDMMSLDTAVMSSSAKPDPEVALTSSKTISNLKSIVILDDDCNRRRPTEPAEAFTLTISSMEVM